MHRGKLCQSQSLPGASLPEPPGVVEEDGDDECRGRAECRGQCPCRGQNNARAHKSPGSLPEEGVRHSLEMSSCIHVKRVIAKVAEATDVCNIHAIDSGSTGIQAKIHCMCSIEATGEWVGFRAML